MIIVKTTTITVIGLYIQPNVPVENVIDLVYKAIEQTRTDKNVILAADLNCRLDKQNAKTHILLETLEEKGFRLANKKEIPTYIAHNGSSTIDLVFYKGEHLKLIKQEGLWSSTAASIRKHIPIKTTFQMEIPQPRKEANGPNIYTRKIEQEIIKQNKDNIGRARTLIEEGKLEEALEVSTEVIKKAVKIRRRKRQAQMWFDHECYKERKETLQALYIAKTHRRREDFSTYAGKRRKYKSTIKRKREEYIEKEARKLAEDAKSNPFIALRKRISPIAGEIHMKEWETHFSEILNKHKKDRAYDMEPTESIHNLELITSTELRQAITGRRNKKAAGPDNTGCLKNTGHNFRYVFPTCRQSK
ncbi:hypothetical protein ANN_24064 [Periplaneta americana]|uniref:Endonuclease/exonuclease/phosphatase domain-containing protein n=1 Tax=Periplaneta americana TaxID=6978 RepID=A0ABQ8S2A3_PERAM|nr:hypothetical protein ANN_24064 [Periplaneta americana]